MSTLHRDIDGIEVTRRIVRAVPGTNVVVMSGASDSNGLLVKAIEAGAVGFMSKVEAATKILMAVRAAAAGQSLLDTETLAWVTRRVHALRTARRATSRRAGRLTERETTILALLAVGKSNEDIADYLVLPFTLSIPTSVICWPSLKRIP